jgi:PAS domain S-box-containing protein
MMLKGNLTLFTTWRDISGRKKAEQALLESEAQFREFFEKAADAIFIAEIESGIILDANEAASKLLLMPHNQIVGMHQSQLHPPVNKSHSHNTFKQHTDSVKQKLSTVPVENVVVRSDGKSVPIEVLASEVILNGKSCIMGTFRDITLRKSAEEALRNSESMLRTLIESAPFEIWARDKDGLGILENENQVRHFGSIIGKTPDHEGISPQISQLWKSNNKRAMIGEIVNDECVYLVDGVKRHFQQILAPVIVDGSIEGITGFNIDITERKHAEELLRESEYFFKESQRAAFVGSYKFDLIADSWTASEVLEQIFGIDKSYNRSLQGWMGIVHPDDREAMTQYFLEEVIGKRQPFNREYRIISQLDQEIRWVLGLGKLNFDEDGNITEMMGTIQDISERKLAELARSETYEFNKSLLQTIPFGMDIVDEEGTVLFQSENIQNIFGSGGKGNKCWDRYRDDKKQCPDCPLHKGIEVGKTEVYETSGVLGRRIFQINHTGIIFKGKKAMLEIFQDITERKQAEEKLKESQQLFQELFDASPDAIVLIDPNRPDLRWPIVDCNKAACQMNGYTHEEMIGQSIDLLNTTLATPEERIAYLDQLRKEEVLHVESYHRHKDGHIFPVEISTSLVTIGGREMVLGIDRDITDRKLAEATVHESDVRLKRAELASKSGNWEFYLDSQIMVGSEGASKVYGLDGDSFRFDIVKKIPLPEFRPALDNALKNLLEKDIPYDIEFKIRTFGTNEIKDIHSVAFFDKEKRVVFGIIQDVTDRKKAEFELVQSEERYRRFISQISEGVYRFECDEPMDLNLSVEDQIDFIYDHLFIAECNKAFQKMYGIDDENEVIGKSHLDFHGGRDNPINRSALRKFVNNGYHIEDVMTEEINPATGQLAYFSNNSLGIIENNQLIRIWGTQADITEKIRTDQIQQVLFSISNAALSSIDLPELIEFISKEVGKLLDSTNFYIAFYDEQTDMLSTIYERDEKDVFETWPAENSITGYVVKQQKSVLLREEDVDGFYKAAGIQAFGTPSKVWLGVPLESNKKTIGAIVVQSYDNVDAYNEKDQQMLEFISHQISISIERKKTEKDLKLMGKAFDQSPVTIVITDKYGNIEYVNPKFTESTGYTQDEVKGQNPRVLKSGYQSKEYYNNLWNTILAGNDWFGEFQNKRKSGESYWESAVISPITDDNGEIAFFLAIKEDITEKKKMIDDLIFARNKAEESDRLKSSFLANMSHEIRTPLNSIIGFSELLLDSDFGTEQHEEFARTINESGNGLLTIISDIMDLSKIEAGQINLTKKRFSAHKLINDIQKEYSHKASSKGIELRIDSAITKEDYSIFNDDQRLKQVLINFVGNAIKFTEEGLIEIGFRTIHNNIQFYVKDTGIGIPEQYHNEIFERFRQVEQSHTRKYGGNGLGLAISKSLVEMLGGEIGMTSELGLGSTFYFTVPLS